MNAAASLCLALALTACGSDQDSADPPIAPASIVDVPCTFDAARDTTAAEMMLMSAEPIERVRLFAYLNVPNINGKVVTSQVEPSFDGPAAFIICPVGDSVTFVLLPPPDGCTVNTACSMCPAGQPCVPCPC